ncbi:hypothetical protein [Methylocystis parvus]|uniref:Uncharacterized protein n=1 Tax=Methylocystis parvus TaxID=134 RepID=A0A6B8MBR5_9HYPH|nr:hypothetical protein [Methylocystis parvus]QGM99069.1 hypothetical protein F7D14_17310 [Methylocystis parvus]WBK00564.1 hypothetical protein MMG94_02230 [Methylocystis parvus OBBP]
MLKLVRFLGLVSQSIFIQFVHVFGLVAFVASAALGWFRLPSWLVPVVAVISGVVADKYIDESSVTGILEKASLANQRGGFLLVVYFVICAVGYVTGAYGRNYMRRGLPAIGAKK